MSSAVASFSRLSPSRMVRRRCGGCSGRSTAVAATASGGATTAPSAIAAAQGMAGTRVWATSATATVVRPTANTTRLVTGAQLSLRSLTDASYAASSNTGATNSASASSGGSVNDGATGTKARNAPPSARNTGYGAPTRRAAAASSTAATNRTRSCSSSLICAPKATSSRRLAAAYNQNLGVLPTNNLDRPGEEAGMERRRSWRLAAAPHCTLRLSVRTDHWAGPACGDVVATRSFPGWRRHHRHARRRIEVHAHLRPRRHGHDTNRLQSRPRHVDIVRAQSAGVRPACVDAGLLRPAIDARSDRQALAGHPLVRLEGRAPLPLADCRRRHLRVPAGGLRARCLQIAGDLQRSGDL